MKRGSARAIMFGTMTLSVVFVAPLGWAGGTAPSLSGSFSTVKWETYHEDSHIQSVALIGKLASETDASNDWYLTSTYMMQLDTSGNYDWPHFWIAGWHHTTWTPDEVSWNPNADNFGTGQFPLSVSIGSSGVTAAINWNHEWTSKWNIDERPDQTNGDWHGKLHHEKANAEGRQYDWSVLTFSAVFRVSQDASAVIGVGDSIKWVNGSPFDCWYPCHQFGPTCSPCKGYVVADHEPSTCITGQGEAPEDCIQQPLVPPEIIGSPPVDALDPEDLAFICGPDCASLPNPPG
jgi:hypothetical protein